MSVGPKTYGTGPLTDDDPRHGTDRGYWKGCRQDCCLRAHSRRKNLQRLYGPHPLIDATGTHRRLKALACMGWSLSRLSQHLGAHRSYLRKIANHDRIQQATATIVADLYDELSMTLCVEPQADRVVERAWAAGWAPPLAWDDATIDDPESEPFGVGDEAPGADPTTTLHTWNSHDGGSDSLAPDRILGGDWRLPCSRDDKVEVVARWLANDGSLRQLEQHTGWNTTRYAADARALLADRDDTRDGEAA